MGIGRGLGLEGFEELDSFVDGDAAVGDHAEDARALVLGGFLALG
jgi:hypothetical protein